MQGTLYKGIAGFYTVKADDGRLLECRARGVLRKLGLKPVAGDRVRLGVEAGTFTVDEVLPRRNLLARPPVANVDRLFIVVATAAPVPSLLVIDKLTAVAADQEIEPVLVVTKPDLASPEPLKEAYRGSGISVLTVGELGAGPKGEPGNAPEGLDDVRALLAGVFSVFCGNTGVGKTSLLNALLPGSHREVGEISRKLGRGRHTTREVEVLEMGGGLVADTPGFASFDVQGAGGILADNLQLCFPEIERLVGQCKFSGCAHLAEAGCAVRAAVQAGKIAPGRYESYVTLYGQAKVAESDYR